MSHTLNLCPSCNRHVRVSEIHCPFCSAAQELVPLPQRVAPMGLSRAALLAFTAAVAAGCPRSSAQRSEPTAIEPPSSPQPRPGAPAVPLSDPGGQVEAYGAPPAPRIFDAALHPDPGARIYGAPPAPADAAIPLNQGSGAGLYGAPPLRR